MDRINYLQLERQSYVVRMRQMVDKMNIKKLKLLIKAAEKIHKDKNNRLKDFKRLN